jgi:hypothetical protein
MLSYSECGQYLNRWPLRNVSSWPKFWADPRTMSKAKKVKLSRYTPWRRLGERRYSLYSSLTSALDRSEWSASRPGRALPPGKGPTVPIGQGAGWAPEPVWTQRLEEKSSASVGDRTPVVQSVVSHYTNWATPAACTMSLIENTRLINKNRRRGQIDNNRRMWDTRRRG